jgi:hypothetical protein
MAVLALQDAEYLWKCVFVYASGVWRGMNDSPAIRERIATPTAGRASTAEAPAEPDCLWSAMTSTVQHAQIGDPRTHCVTILVGHHAG